LAALGGESYSKRQRREEGACGVVGAEKGVREKAGEDGGGALLKGCGREAAEGGMGGEGAT
jgi:hypothetical protein